MGAQRRFFARKVTYFLNYFIGKDSTKIRFAMLTLLGIVVFIATMFYYENAIAINQKILEREMKKYDDLKIEFREMDRKIQTLRNNLENEKIVYEDVDNEYNKHVKDFARQIIWMENMNAKKAGYTV